MLDAHAAPLRARPGPKSSLSLRSGLPDPGNKDGTGRELGKLAASPSFKKTLPDFSKRCFSEREFPLATRILSRSNR